jgi:predicted Zn-dependent protease
LSAVCAALPLVSGGVQQDSERLLAAMAAELERSLRALKEQPEPPYYLAYEISEIENSTSTSSFGHIVERRVERRRQLDVDLRVGQPEIDNTRALRGGVGGASAGERYRFIEMPLDDDSVAVRTALWRATDRSHREAVEALRAVRTNVRVKVEATDPSPDFSAAPRVGYLAPRPELRVDLEAWRHRLNRYSEPFGRDARIYQADARLLAQRETRWFVNSERSRIRTASTSFRLDIWALTKADDGMELPRRESFFAFTAEELPSDEEVLAVVEQMMADLAALRSAPVVEPYTGPALLSGRAAGVFFHEVLGHRIEGHRQKSEEEGQTFKGKVGERVLPPGFSVAFDPELSKFGNLDLAGFYRFDNEGVEARRVEAVADGRFRHFLMSRSPIAGEPRSNGHGRRQPGYPAVARQSNLLVEVADPSSRAELETKFLELIAASGWPFGLFFADIQGGFTQTGRRVPNAFNVLPIMVYKVYPDGRRELVRGVDLIGTPLVAFSQIVAASDDYEVFNGMCGAESGAVPVAAVSPSLLVSQIEAQRKQKSQERPPLMAPPSEGQELK